MGLHHCATTDYHINPLKPQRLLPSSSSSAISLKCFENRISSAKSEHIRLEWCTGLRNFVNGRRSIRKRGIGLKLIVASSNLAAAPFSWDEWKPKKGSEAPSISDVVWPAAGAFAAMALMGKIDQMLAAKGVSMTIAPFGAVCAVLFTTPSAPSARKYNMFMAQIGCAAIGVLAFSIFGPGWLARSAGLAAAIAFMIYTRATHPPAASLPILFIDGTKLHHLNFWYAFFPGAAGCILLCLIQEVVYYLKENFRF